MQIKLIILFTILSLNIMAQNSISGKITDSKTSENIIGATVYIPELEKGSYTDEYGNYKIKNLPNGEFTIKYSYVGYKTEIARIELHNVNQVQNIKLSPTHYDANETVISAAGYTSQHHYAIKIESIDAKALETDASISIMEKMQRIPGVDIISQGSGISTPNIRGLSLSNVLILSDGFRMNNYQFSEHHPYLVSDYGISKVEVIKGPASLLYGSDAVGGVINFISEKPAAVGKLEADFNTTFHSNTHGYQTNIGVKAHGKKLFWGVRAGKEQHKDFVQGNGKKVVNSRFADKNISLTTGLNSKIGSYKIIYSFKDAHLGLTNPKSKNLITNNEYNSDAWFQKLEYHILKSKNKIYLKKFKLDVNFAYQTNRRRLFGINNYLIDMNIQSFDYEIKASRSLREISKSNDSKIVFGIQGNYTQNITGNAPVKVLPNYFQNDISGFALIQHDFGKKIHAQIGGRYDLRNMKIPEFYSSEIGGITNIDTNYHNFSFTAGLTFELTKHLFLRTNYASAFRTANIAELTQEGMHGNRYERGNAHLNSQNSNEIDLGIHFHNSKFAFDLAAFYNKIDNYIFLSPSNDTTVSGNKIYQYGQTNSTIYGLESGLQYAVLKQMEINASYAYSHGIQQNGDYLPFIPQNKINAEIKYKVRTFSIFNNSQIGISGVYAFSKSDISPFEDNAKQYFLLNAAISTTLKFGKQKVKFGVYANNILNTKYIDHLSTIQQYGYYNMGRNISVKISIPLEVSYGL